MIFDVSFLGHKIFAKNKFFHFVKTFDADHDGILHLQSITARKCPKTPKVCRIFNFPRSQSSKILRRIGEDSSFLTIFHDNFVNRPESLTWNRLQSTQESCGRCICMARDHFSPESPSVLTANFKNLTKRGFGFDRFY